LFAIFSPSSNPSGVLITLLMEIERKKSLAKGKKIEFAGTQELNSLDAI
jgi:hypothetical protein